LHSLLADTYSFWLPQAATRDAVEHSDPLFYFILWINIIFSSLIMALLVIFLIKYRHREGVKKHDPTGGHSTALELTWTIIPTFLVFVIFWYGFRGFLHANVMPPNANQVTCNAKMWNWSFTYDTGLTDPELHLVVDKPTVMILESADVLHDLDIPAFRMKKDAVPGRYNREWFEPNVKGSFEIYCAMYCGQNHSTMLATCVVQDKADYDKWMADKLDWQKKMSFIDRGRQIHQTFGCATCHSVEAGVVVKGPSWRDVYGSTVALEGGGSVLADDAYIQESVYQPAAKIVKGFQNIMPSFEGQLKANDIQALTWYLKSISKDFKGDLTPGQTIGSGKHPATGPAVAPTTQPVAALVTKE